jgi:hypothetical protein
MGHASWHASTLAFVVGLHGRNPMFTLEAAPVRDRRQPQPENSRGLGQDDAFYHRHLVATGLEMKAMTRVPALDWRSDLFADAHVGIPL